MPDTALARPPRPARLWKPKRVLVTRSAGALPHGRAMAERAAAIGCEVEELAGDRLTGLSDMSYADAKSTLGIVVAPPSKRRFQPIPPSADWRIDLAEGCPAHCHYCYLAGSLSGPPITRAYANLSELLGAVDGHLGRGGVTSTSDARAHEGTTFEASCYTDPLALEHITGSLAAAIEWFGAHEAHMQLRFTTKFAAVEPLVGLAHGGRTRMRASVNAPAMAKLEGGTDPVALRLVGLGRMARAGYPVGLTVAPIFAFDGWREGYGALIDMAAAELAGIEGLDLTVELITHRFTEGSKAVLTGWYPGSPIDMAEETRSKKRNKFGGVKYVYTPEQMRELRGFFESGIAEKLPGARVLYWT